MRTLLGRAKPTMPPARMIPRQSMPTVRRQWRFFSYRVRWDAPIQRMATRSSVLLQSIGEIRRLRAVLEQEDVTGLAIHRDCVFAVGS